MNKPVYRIIFSYSTFAIFDRYLIQVRKWCGWRTVETAMTLDAAIWYLCCISSTLKHYDADGKEIKEVADGHD